MERNGLLQTAHASRAMEEEFTKMKLKNFVGGLALAAAAASGMAQAETIFSSLDMGTGVRGTQADMQPMEQFCGNKKISVAYSDGSGGNTWSKISRAELEDEASKCDNIVEVTYVDAQANPQKQISDIQSLTAQGYDVIVVFATGGEAVLRATRQAMEAGVAVVVWQAGIEFPGTPGEEYVANVTIDQVAMGSVWMEWIAEGLGGKGNVLAYGGTAGASQTASQYEGIKQVLAEYPELNLLEPPVVTGWDPANYQKLTPALLAKYPKIDAVYSDYGTGVMGAMRAFKEAGRDIPLVSAQAATELACFWNGEKAAQPGFQIGTESAFNWLVRIALHKGVAAAQGLDNTEPTIVLPTIIEDSLDANLQPVCDETLPPDVSVASVMLNREQLVALFTK